MLVIRSRRALRRLLWTSGELGLARVYVSGDIGVDGDLARLAPGVAADRRPTAGPTEAQRRDIGRAVTLAARPGAFGAPPRARALRLA